MQEINLWPWREEIIFKRRKNFFIILVGMVFFNAIVFLYINSSLAHALQSNKFAIVFIKKQIQNISAVQEEAVFVKNKQILSTKIKTVKSCVAQYRGVILILSALTALFDEQIKLISINVDHNHWVLQGNAPEAMNVTRSIEVLEKKSPLQQLRLIQMKHSEEGRGERFAMEGFMVLSGLKK